MNVPYKRTAGEWIGRQVDGHRPVDIVRVQRRRAAIRRRQQQRRTSGPVYPGGSDVTPSPEIAEELLE